MRARSIVRLAFGVAVLMSVGTAFAQDQRRDEGGDRPRLGGVREQLIERLRWAPEDVREVMLLVRPRVQDELNLTDEQVDQIKQAVRKVGEKHRDEIQGLAKAEGRERAEKFRALVNTGSDEVRKELDGILKPEQNKRLQQLAIQFSGPAALTDPEFREKLNLTDEQIKQLRGIRDEFFEGVRELPRDPEDRDEARQKYRDLWRATRAKVRDVLTAEQRAKWRELAGEPFDFDIRPDRRDDRDDDRGAGEGRGRRPERKDDDRGRGEGRGERPERKDANP
jgi:hypothetical protein